MLSLSSGFNYYFCKEPVTLRYRFDGLRNYIRSQLRRDPTNGDVYVFLSKDFRSLRIYYFHHQGEILTEKRLNSDHFVEPVFDEEKCCYRIPWESFVYLVEGLVLSDRKVPFEDLDDEDDEEEPAEEDNVSEAKQEEDNV